MKYLIFILLFYSNLSLAQLKSIKENPNAKSAVIFIHGLNGNSDETWKNSNDFHFAKAFSADNDLSNFEVFTFQYPAGCENVTPSEAANNLSEEIKALNRKFERFNLITHSLGGVIARQLLLQNNAVKIETIQLLGTPNLGTGWSSLASAICTVKFQSRINELGSGRGSYLDNLNDMWRVAFEQNDNPKKFLVFAAFEVPQGYEPTFVDKDSALLFSSKTIYFPTGHTGLAKPENTEDSIYKWVKGNIINNGSAKQTSAAPKDDVKRSIYVKKMIDSIEKKIGRDTKNSISKSINSRSLSEARTLIANQTVFKAVEKSLYLGLLWDLSGNYREAVKNYSLSYSFSKSDELVDLTQELKVRMHNYEKKKNNIDEWGYSKDVTEKIRGLLKETDLEKHYFK